jgi:outer membrane protein OmpA-like peptidoglycan-associated protein
MYTINQNGVYIMKNKTIKIVSIFICLLFTLGACTTINPYTEEKQTSKLVIGAGIGAASGALIGYLTTSGKKRRKNALIGAGIGAVAGGSIGYYMDVQEAKLREELRGTGVSVTRQGDNIILNMPGNITFKTGSSNLMSKFYGVLNSVAKVLNKYKKTYIDITGHTDNVGSNAYNQKLSEERATSVADYLASQNVLPQRMLKVGYGENHPIATNSTTAGRAQNRRVTIEISPVTE